MRYVKSFRLVCGMPCGQREVAHGSGGGDWPILLPLTRWTEKVAQRPL